jgi:hypothetical protein
MKMLGLYDSYTIIFTPVQIIVARLTNNVIKDVVNQSQAKSKAEGKGWMGIVGDQMQAFGAAHTRYYKMTPQQILTETAGNFALDHRSINLVKVKTGCEGGDEEGPGVDYTEVEFETAAVKYKYRLSMNAKDVINILNNFYPGRIKR